MKRYLVLGGMRGPSLSARAGEMERDGSHGAPEPHRLLRAALFAVMAAFASACGPPHPAHPSLVQPTTRCATSTRASRHAAYEGRYRSADSFDAWRCLP